LFGLSANNELDSSKVEATRIEADTMIVGFFTYFLAGSGTKALAIQIKRTHLQKSVTRVT
jgi:hypothetical protein